MEEKSDEILVYNRYYYDQEPQTNNGLVYWIVATSEGGTCPECGGYMTFTHGKISESQNIHVFECYTCGYDEISKEGVNCEVCK